MTTKEIAQQLLDAEFESFTNEPLEYCLSMNWSEDSPSTQKAIQNAQNIIFDSSDVTNLTSILDSSNTTDILKLIGENSVSDFLCNCVASHIIAN